MMEIVKVDSAVGKTVRGSKTTRIAGGPKGSFVITLMAKCDSVLLGKQLLSPGGC